MSHPAEQTRIPAPIPDEHAHELRHLAHDLSNALEIIVQTTYLLQHSDNDSQTAQWVAMLDEGVQKAVKLNEKLRVYLRTHSEQ
jgi:hypothetical protein